MFGRENLWLQLMIIRGWEIAYLNFNPRIPAPAAGCEANRGRRLIRRRGRRHQKSITAPLQLLCFSPPFLWMKSQIKFFVAKSLSYIHTCPIRLAVENLIVIKMRSPEFASNFWCLSPLRLFASPPPTSDWIDNSLSLQKGKIVKCSDIDFTTK